MLVLSRQREQRILLGDDIRITVIAIEGGRVRIGIEAPPQVVVLRGELKGSGQELDRTMQRRDDAVKTPDHPVE
jgi:carbon storage regulator